MAPPLSSLGASPVMQPLAGNAEEMNATDVKVDKAATKSFIVRKAVSHGIEAGGCSTGWIGALVGLFLGAASDATDNPNLTKEQQEAIIKSYAAAGYKVASLVGMGTVGVVLSTGSVIKAVVSKEVVFSSSQVKEVRDFLQVLLPTLAQYNQDQVEGEEVRLFKTRIDNVKRLYGSPGWFSSASSGELIRALHEEESSLHSLAAAILDYLGDTAQALSCVNGEQCLKNQGKRLFNIIMQEFLTAQ